MVTYVFSLAPWLSTGCPNTVVSGSQAVQPWQEEERRRDTICVYYRVRLGCR